MSPILKKCRSLTVSAPQSPPEVAIKGLSQTQLVEVLKHVLDRHPELKGTQSLEIDNGIRMVTAADSHLFFHLLNHYLYLISIDTQYFYFLFPIFFFSDAEFFLLYLSCPCILVPLKQLTCLCKSNVINMYQVRGIRRFSMPALTFSSLHPRRAVTKPWLILVQILNQTSACPLNITFAMLPLQWLYCNMVLLQNNLYFTVLNSDVLWGNQGEDFIMLLILFPYTLIANLCL